MEYSSKLDHFHFQTRPLRSETGHRLKPGAVLVRTGRITGTFDVTYQEDADEMINMINAVKPFLKKKEAAN